MADLFEEAEGSVHFARFGRAETLPEAQTARPSVRLNKYLADCGICSRREADRMLAQGLVTVDGRAAPIGGKVPLGAEVRVNGRLVTPVGARVVLAVNKPKGVVCTTDKTWGDVTVGDLVDYPTRVFYCGRLDKNSEGLLLMTNDGDLQNRMMRSANGHEKEYEVCVDRPLCASFLEEMARGVYLEELGVRTRPCQVAPMGERQFRIVLTQGLNRQIRRMCEALGYVAESIRRVRVMNIRLGDLAPGAYRELTKEEYGTLLQMLGICTRFVSTEAESAKHEKKSQWKARNVYGQAKGRNCMEGSEKEQGYGWE